MLDDYLANIVVNSPKNETMLNVHPAEHRIAYNPAMTEENDAAALERIRALSKLKAGNAAPYDQFHVFLDAPTAAIKSKVIGVAVNGDAVERIAVGVREYSRLLGEINALLKALGEPQVTSLLSGDGPFQIEFSPGTPPFSPWVVSYENLMTLARFNEEIDAMLVAGAANGHQAALDKKAQLQARELEQRGSA